jgi:ribonuclease G
LKREIIVNCEKLETRVAVLENGKLEEYQVEHPMDERFVGSIFKGRIQNLENDLQAAFVNIGMRKNAFLHYWDMNPDDDAILDEEEMSEIRHKPRNKRFTNEEIAARYPIGSVITVQVSKGAIGTKGPRITASLSIPGRYLVLMPNSTLRGVSRKIGDAHERERLKKILTRMQKYIPEDCGLIVRTAGMGVSKSAFIRDLRVVLSSYSEMKQAIAEQPAPCCVYEEPDLIMRVIRDWMTEDVDRIVIDNPEVYERVRKEAAKISRRARNLITLYEGHYPIFDHYGIEKQIEDAFHRKIPLPSGAYLIIDETTAPNIG